MARRRIVLSNRSSTFSFRFGVGTESNGVLIDCLGIVADGYRLGTDCLGTVADGYRLGTDCRGADARSQSIIAGSTLIFVVGIRIWFDRFHAVIVDATAAGSASATTKLGYSRF